MIVQLEEWKISRRDRRNLILWHWEETTHQTTGQKKWVWVNYGYFGKLSDICHYLLEGDIKLSVKGKRELRTWLKQLEASYKKLSEQIAKVDDSLT